MPMRTFTVRGLARPGNGMEAVALALKVVSWPGDRAGSPRFSTIVWILLLAMAQDQITKSIVGDGGEHAFRR